LAHIHENWCVRSSVRGGERSSARGRERSGVRNQMQCAVSKRVQRDERRIAMRGSDPAVGSAFVNL
jgi:hypothetical protein